MNTTVLIVDDHETFRSFARAILESDGFEVIAEAGDGTSGIEAVTSRRPDLVVLDVQLPDINGFEVLKRLRSEGDATPVVLTSSRDATSYGDQVDSSGAVGFVPKAELSGAAIRALLEGVS
ncbi:MAG TPA: response regulator transcription factor [Actinomycetota bacterium]|nr:response regulator transcription factor [Actinomycetota bacterium]